MAKQVQLADFAIAKFPSHIAKDSAGQAVSPGSCSSATEAEALFSDWNLVHQSSDPVARIPAEPGMHRLSGHPVALSHVGHDRVPVN